MPTRAIITVACQTLVMKNVDIIKHPKRTNPAVQMFLNMNGTGFPEPDDTSAHVLLVDEVVAKDFTSG